ncbi:hypothetical protein AB0C38_10025 [Amycolatopsis sp. NPDC048633]|uniref:hypothetical protein n=1 Tax=Amycolatopsis sp. NPDC048633 TaxID=3157095 RepID=UPI0033F9C01F
MVGARKNGNASTTGNPLVGELRPGVLNAGNATTADELLATLAELVRRRTLGFDSATNTFQKSETKPHFA